jgi:hypothetical protein
MLVTWEAVTALSTLASAVVVAIAATAAVLQIRHLRAGNQLAAVLRIYDIFNGPEMVQARKYCLYELPALLADDAARAAIAGAELDPRVLLVGNFANEVGALVVDGFLDQRLIWPLVPLTARVWHIVAPLAHEFRRDRSDPVWADFEYLAALEERVDRERHVRRFPSWFRSRLRREKSPDDQVS